MGADSQNTRLFNKNAQNFPKTTNAKLFGKIGENKKIFWGSFWRRFLGEDWRKLKSVWHQRIYHYQVLGDEKVVSCKMSNIQSKNFNMETQYIYKRALVNYENKRYWLDSIYSLPYGHPWIAKIKAGTMRNEEAVDRLRGTDNYIYKLNAYDMTRR